MQLISEWLASDRSRGVEVLSYGLDRGDGWPEHDHDKDQFAWASSGSLSVEIAGSRWDLPPSLGIWIPAATPHRIGASRRAEFVSLYLVGRAEPLWTEPTVVAVTPLLREMVCYLADPQADAVRASAEDFLLDLVAPAESVSAALPMPVDPRARDVADALLADPADRRDLDAWARAVATSPRHLRRLFSEETGLSPSEWRTRARMQEAIALLGEGVPVARIAGEVGYTTASAFVAAFHRSVGHTPGRYAASARNAALAGAGPGRAGGPRLRPRRPSAVRRLG